MRLQKLTIHNIASVEDAVIDFDSHPLADSDVFLITGKTGSGKSTILDAICLALYSSTPRLKNTSMQGDVADGDKSIKINDPRQLMRRNTGEAYVELTFVGNNGIPYKSRWSVARAHNRVSGNLQSKKWVLTDLQTGYVLSKDEEIREEIAKATGLDFGQFCRTTLLAQGEFTKFLNSKDDEKAVILEKITGVSIYSRIGSKVFDITADKRKEWMEMESRCSGMATLSDDRRKSLQTELAAADEECERLVGHRVVFSKALGHMTSMAMYSDEMKSLDDASDVLVGRFAMIKAGVDEMKVNAAALETKIRETAGRIETEATRSSALDEYKSILADMRVIYDARKRIAEEESGIRKLLEAFEGSLKQEYERCVNEREEAGQMLDARKSRHKELELKVSEAGISGLRKEKDRVQAFLNELSAASMRLQNLEKERARHEQAAEALQKMNLRISEMNGQVTSLEPEIEAASIRRETALEMLERQKASVDSWAKSIRAKLRNGDICPVCGQEVVNAAFDEQMLDMLYMEAESVMKEADGHYAALNAEKDALNAQIAAFTAQYETALKAHEEDRSLADAASAFAVSCAECGLDPDSHDIISAIASQKDSADKVLGGLMEKIRQGEVMEGELREAAKLLDECWNGFRKAEESVAKAERDRKECGIRIETGRKMVEDRLNDISEAEKSVSAYVVPDMWKNDWRTDMVSFAHELKGAAQSYVAMAEELRKLRAENEKVVSQLDTVEAAVGEILAINDTWREISPSASYDGIHELSDAANRLLADVISVRDRRRNAMERLEGEGKMLAGLTEENGWLAEYHDVAGLEEKLEEMDRLIADCSATKGRLQQTLHQDDINMQQKGELIREAERLKKEYEKWSRMNALIGDATGKKFRQIAQSYILSDLINSANHYMRSLTDRYTLKVVPGTFVIMVEDAYQGYASRAASTISGGESFLVSLSLALALSDIGQQLSVDILFIDEGFGTLSGDPLQNAISTLRALHRKAGRWAGIISHVEELREKIPVQIKVNQEGTESSSKIEVL